MIARDKSASAHVKAAQLPTSVDINNPDSVGTYLHDQPKGSQMTALQNIRDAGGSLDTINKYRQKSYGGDIGNYIMSSALTLGGGALGTYALYQALRKNPTKKELRNPEQAQQAQEGLMDAVGPGVTMQKDAGELFNLVDAAQGAKDVGRATIGAGYKAIAGLADTKQLSPWNDVRSTIPLIFGIPAMGYAGYQLARTLRPKKYDALKHDLKNEVSQFDQALKREYRMKTASLEACEDLLSHFEEQFEKKADILDKLKALYVPAAMLATGASGVATYKMMHRLDPNRIAYQAAKDAYRRQQMVQRPKVKVTTVDQGENPDDVSNLSSSETLVIPLPHINGHTKTSAFVKDACARFEKEVGPISIFNNWYNGLDQVEKIASLVNMVKQAQINAEQALQLTDNDEMINMLQQGAAADPQADMWQKLFAKMPTAVAREAVIAKIRGGDTGFLDKINKAAASNPEVAAKIQAALAAPAANPSAPNQPPEAGGAAAATTGNGGKSGDMVGNIGQWIMDNPMRAAGIAASLLAMGSGHQAIGLIGLLVSAFGPQIWNFLGKFFQGGPAEAQARAEEASKSVGEGAAPGQDPGLANPADERPAAGADTFDINDAAKEERPAPGADTFSQEDMMDDTPVPSNHGLPGPKDNGKVYSTVPTVDNIANEAPTILGEKLPEEGITTEQPADMSAPTPMDPNAPVAPPTNISGGTRTLPSTPSLTEADITAAGRNIGGNAGMSLGEGLGANALGGPLATTRLGGIPGNAGKMIGSALGGAVGSKLAPAIKGLDDMTRAAPLALNAAKGALGSRATEVAQASQGAAETADGVISGAASTAADTAQNAATGASNVGAGVASKTKSIMSDLLAPRFGPPPTGGISASAKPVAPAPAPTFNPGATSMPMPKPKAQPAPRPAALPGDGASMANNAVNSIRNSQPTVLNKPAPAPKPLSPFPGKLPGNGAAAAGNAISSIANSKPTALTQPEVPKPSTPVASAK